MPRKKKQHPTDPNLAWCNRGEHWEPKATMVKDAGSSDGLASICITHSREKGNNHYDIHKDEMRQKSYDRYHEDEEASRQERRDRYDQNPEIQRSYRRDSHNRNIEHSRELKRETSRKDRLKHPLEIAARNAVNTQVRKGAIPRADSQQCAHTGCEEQAAHYHHYKGYMKVNWLDVIPLCLEHHEEADRQII